MYIDSFNSPNAPYRIGYQGQEIVGAVMGTVVDEQLRDLNRSIISRLSALPVGTFGNKGIYQIEGTSKQYVVFEKNHETQKLIAFPYHGTWSLKSTQQITAVALAILAGIGASLVAGLKFGAFLASAAGIGVLSCGIVTATALLAIYCFNTCDPQVQYEQREALLRNQLLADNDLLSPKEKRALFFANPQVSSSTLISYFNKLADKRVLTDLEINHFQTTIEPLYHKKTSFIRQFNDEIRSLESAKAMQINDAKSAYEVSSAYKMEQSLRKLESNFFTRGTLQNFRTEREMRAYINGARAANQRQLNHEKEQFECKKNLVEQTYRERMAELKREKQFDRTIAQFDIGLQDATSIFFESHHVADLPLIDSNVSEEYTMALLRA